MLLLALSGIDRRQALRRPPGCRHTKQSVAVFRRKDDGVIGTPTRPSQSATLQLTNGRRWPAEHRDPLERPCASIFIDDPLTVAGKQWAGGRVGAL